MNPLGRFAAFVEPCRPPPRQKRGKILPAKAVEKMRAARDEIIIVTGVKLRDRGVHLWDWRSLAIFADRPQKGWPAHSCGHPAGRTSTVRFPPRPETADGLLRP